MTFPRLLAILVVLYLFWYTVKSFYLWWKGLWIAHNRRMVGDRYDGRWGK